MASTSAAASLGSRACRTAACASARRPPIALLTPALGTHTSTSARRFHTSRPNFDHYQTLKVDRSASMKDIKNSFYQLSKKYHPDVNRNDDGAKKKFQEVSEAWSVLGEEKSKREYDRKLRYGSMGGSGGSYSSGFAPRRYDSSDNTSRRARATYAWDYQRRQGDSNRSRAGQHRYGAGAEARASSSASSASARNSKTLFEEHAERQRRRENYLNARAASSNDGTGSSASTANFAPSADEHEAQTGSAWLRFFQTFAALATIGIVGMTFSSRVPSRYRPYGTEGLAGQSEDYRRAIRSSIVIDEDEDDQRLSYSTLRKSSMS